MGTRNWERLTVEEAIDFLENGGHIFIQPSRGRGKRSMWDIFRFMSKEEMLITLKKIANKGETILRVLADAPERLGKVFLRACESVPHLNSYLINYRCPICNWLVTHSFVGSAPQKETYGNYCENCGVQFNK